MRFIVQEVHISGYGHHTEYWIKDTIKQERLCMCKWVNIAHDVCKIMNQGDNNFQFNQNVIASNNKDFDPYWKAIYISKHPTENSHVVILPARPDLNLKESTSIFEFVKPNE